MPIGLYLQAAKWLAAFLVLAAITWWVYSKGEGHVQAQWDAEKAQLQAAHYAEVERLNSINRSVEVRYLPKLQYVRGNTEQVLKEVPVYVPQAANAACTIPPGFISLLNAAAQGRVPPTGGTDSADGAGALAGAIPGALHAE